MRICHFLILFLFVLISFRSAQAQTCNANIPASTPDSQLTDNGDGTITDSKTGLMWKKCVEGVSGSNCDSGAVGSFTWQTALQQTDVVNNGSGFAGHTDWRLPNIKELVSLVEEKCYDPSINLTRFPNTPPGNILSGSPSAAYSWCYAWVVEFYEGVAYDGNRVNGLYQVRLVRGGQ
ncbi:MAG: DUF1566 domain-containing protein [Desulfocapsaceae bacterium]|nr:DUF1566 domain-containing protein [Desulfocapsaceae bacterium]